jgi:uncharacterized protein YbjT (DUF2867 family)
MAKILITGANGTIGTATVRALRAAGAEVRAGLRSPEKGGLLRELGADIVPFDLSAPATLRSALDGVERMLLITPFVEHATELVTAAVEAAKEAGVSFLLRLSGLGADAESPALLARQHGVGERIVRDSGIAAAVIRPSFFMDNLINFSGASIKAEGAIYGAAGDGKVAFLSSRDIGRVAATILGNPEERAGKTYVLTGPSALDHDQAARALGAAIGKEVRYVNLAPEQLAAGMRQRGLPEFAVEGLVFLERVKAQGWASGVTSSVADITGRTPETLAEFLSREAHRLR